MKLFAVILLLNLTIVTFCGQVVAPGLSPRMAYCLGLGAAGLIAVISTKAGEYNARTQGERS